MKLKALILAALLLSGSSAFALLPVIDTASIAQLVHEVELMNQQIQLARQTYFTMQQQLQSVQGVYGWGNVLSTGKDFVNQWQWSANQWDSALQGEAGGNQDRYNQLRTEYQQNNYYMNQQTYAKSYPGQTAQAYNNEVQTNQAAGPMSQEAFENINKHVSEIQQLIGMTEDAKNSDIKSATDLNSRIAGEGALVSSETARVDTLISNQMASQQAYDITGQTEAAQFDAGDQQY